MLEWNGSSSSSNNSISHQQKTSAGAIGCQHGHEDNYADNDIDKNNGNDIENDADIGRKTPNCW